MPCSLASAMRSLRYCRSRAMACSGVSAGGVSGFAGAGGRRGERDQHRFLAGLDRGHDAVRAGLLVSRQPGETDLGFRLGRFLLQPDLLEVRPQLGVHTTLLSQNIDHA